MPSVLTKFLKEMRDGRARVLIAKSSALLSHGAFLFVGINYLGFNKNLLTICWIVSLCLIFQIIQLRWFGEQEKDSFVGALISSFGIANLISAGHQGMVYFLFPCFVTIAAKAVFRFQNKHIYNPTALAIVCCALFTKGHLTVTPGYQWGSANWISLMILIPGFFIVLPLSRRVPIALAFIVSYTGFLWIRASFINTALPFYSLFWGSLTAPSLILFTCYMITDPVTTPRSNKLQALAGFSTAALDFAFHRFKSYYSFFYALIVELSCRFLFNSYREFGGRNLPQVFKDYLINRKWQLAYFFVGFVVFNPAVWDLFKTLEDPGFQFVKDTAIMEKLSAPMIKMSEFPIDPRLKHLAKWLLFTEPVVIADIDNDGQQDLFILGALKQETERGLWVLHPEEQPKKVYVEEIQKYLRDYKKYGYPTGVTVADYDNDGKRDMFITFMGGQEGGLRVFHNVTPPGGELQFEEVSEKLGLREANNSLGLTLLDFDQDGKLDLFVINHTYKNLPDYSTPVHLDLFSLPAPEFEGDKRATDFMINSWVRSTSSDPNILYLNKGDHFEKVDGQKIGLTEKRVSLAVGASDLNHDGYPDIYVANDAGPDNLYFNESGKYLRLIQGQGSQAIGQDYSKGMTVTIGDFEGKGWNDVYVSNIHHPFIVEGSMLWSFSEDSFKDPQSIKNLASPMGVLNEDRWGWGAAVRDFNNDGMVDLVQADGMFDASWEGAESCIDYFYLNEKMVRSDYHFFKNAANWADTRGACLFGDEKNRVFIAKENEKGERHFYDSAELTGLTEAGPWRAVAAGDFSNSGRYDIVITSPFKSPLFYRNQSTSKVLRHWIGFDLESLSPRCHREAFNSWVTISYVDSKGKKRSQFQEKLLVNGFSSQGDSRIHFGLDDYAGNVQAQIMWCGRFPQNLSLPADQYHHLIFK